MDRLGDLLEKLRAFELPAIALAVDWRTIIAYAFGILLLYVTVRLLAGPMRFTARLAFHTLVGAVLLLTFNLVGGYFGQTLPLNPVTTLVAGVLGVPGVALLVALRFVYGLE